MEGTISFFHDLPTELQYKIISCLTYDELSKTRMVCKSFNQICMHELNNGFHRVDRLRAKIQKDVKAHLPRRESERRAHSLSRHVDVLSAVETRISLLNMTYSKYIEMNLCCFIPGKVLDELFLVLRIIQSSKKLPFCSTLLQELRDISSMAMEHFDDAVLPQLRKLDPRLTQQPLPYQLLPTSPSINMDGYMPFSEPVTPKPSTKSLDVHLHESLRSTKQTVVNLKSTVYKMGKVVNHCKQKITEHEQDLAERDKVIKNQNKKIKSMQIKFNYLFRNMMEMKQQMSPNCLPDNIQTYTELKNRRSSLSDINLLHSDQFVFSSDELKKEPSDVKFVFSSDELKKEPSDVKFVFSSDELKKEPSDVTRPISAIQSTDKMINFSTSTRSSNKGSRFSSINRALTMKADKDAINMKLDLESASTSTGSEKSKPKNLLKRKLKCQDFDNQLREVLPFSPVAKRLRSKD